MAILVSPIQNTYISIDKQCIDAVVNQLILDGIIPKYERYIHSDQISSTTRINASGAVYSPGELTLSIRATQSYPDQSDWTLNRRWAYNPPLFRDPSLGVSVHPLYLDQETVIELTYTSDSLERLRRIHDNLFTQRSLGWYGSQHTLKYNMVPDIEVIDLLEIIHGLREAKHGYGEGFEEYVLKHSDSSVHVIQGGSHQEIAYAHTQLQIEGNMRGDIPDIEEVNTNVYSITLSYTFRYSKVLATIMEYPIQVHQQLLPKQYVLVRNSERPKAYCFSDTVMLRGLSTPEAMYQNTIRIPAFDTTPLSRYPNYYHPIWTALVSLPDTDTLICNILDIEDIAMHPCVLNAIVQRYHGDMAIPYKCPFMITIHRDDNLLHWGTVRMDSDLNIHAVATLNKRGVYRISFCLCTDLTAVPFHNLAPFQQSPCNTILTDAINEAAMLSNRRISPPNFPMIPGDLNETLWLKNVAPLIQNGVDGTDPWLHPETATRSTSGAIGYRTAMVTSVAATALTRR